MRTKLTNLLPRERVRAMERGYYYRLVAAFTFALALLVVIQGGLLFPAYQYAKQESSAHRAHLAELENATSVAEGKSVAERLGALATLAERAQTLMEAPPASAAIRSILAVPRPGVLVERFTVETANGARVIMVSGTASNRESLRTYHLALEALAFVERAELPLSAYTLESAIPFSISLTTKAL